MKHTLSTKEFRQVFRCARRYKGTYVRLFIDKRDTEEGSVSVVAAKRLGNAVFRNRSKRLLRESARICGLPEKGYAVILFSTTYTCTASPEIIADELSGLMERAHERI